MKPAIFVGSSVESLPIAYAVQEELSHDADITVWTQGIFQLSSTAIDDLLKNLEKFDFAIFIFSPDDLVKIKDHFFSATRDNVLFELGLFISELGKQRNFIVLPMNHDNFRFPTDLLGMTPGTYDAERSDGNMQAALGPTCNKIRIAFANLGVFERKPSLPSIFTMQPEDAFYHIRIQRLITEKKIEDEPKFSLNLTKSSLMVIANKLHEGKRIQIAGVSVNGFDINNGFMSLCVLRSSQRIDTTQFIGSSPQIKDLNWEKLQYSDDVLEITAELDITDISAIVGK